MSAGVDGPHRWRRSGLCPLLNAVRLAAIFPLVACMNREAAADWDFLFVADDADWYVDEALTRKRGTMAKVWTLQEYRNGQPFQNGEYLSSKTQVEIRCHSKQWRVLYFSSYSGHMGEGKQLYTQEAAGAWQGIASGTYSAALYQAGCQPGQN